MSDAFISYRRNPSASLAQLIQVKLERDHGIDAYVDTTRTDSTRVKFPERLMKAIEDSPTFICLLADSTLESDWVRKEIWRAYELGKHCVPVFQESYVPTEETDEAIEYLLEFDGVHVLDVKNVFIDEAVSQIAALVVRVPKQRRLPLIFGGIIVLLVVVGIVGVMLLGGGGESNDNLSALEFTETETHQDEVASIPTASEAPPAVTITDGPTRATADTNTNTPIATPTLSPTEKPTTIASPVFMGTPTSVDAPDNASGQGDEIDIDQITSAVKSWFIARGWSFADQHHAPSLVIAAVIALIVSSYINSIAEEQKWELVKVITGCISPVAACYLILILSYFLGWL